MELLGIGGYYIDITEQYDADLQKHLSEALLAVDSRRAVINQAMGILMLRYGIDSDAAFERLVKMSQESNVKLRNIAELVVAEIAGNGDHDEDAAFRLDRLVRTPREVR